jgi:hypothetical protein
MGIGKKGPGNNGPGKNGTVIKVLGKKGPRKKRSHESRYISGI